MGDKMSDAQVLDPEIEDIDLDDEDDEDDDDNQFWVILYKDGRLQSIDHPEDAVKEKVFEEFLAIKRGGDGLFVLNFVAVDVTDVRSFGWGETQNVPEIEGLDSVMARMDAIGQGLETLMGAQAELQVAQAGLFEEEVQAMQAEKAVNRVKKPKPKPSGGKKRFVPPT